MDVLAEIARREERLAAIAEAKAKIEARAQERDAVWQAEYQEKVARREAQRAAGKKPRGKEPTPPTTGPQANDQINLTDEESRIMPTGGGFVHYALRKQTVEPVFGIIKQVMGFRQFLLRGMEKSGANGRSSPWPGISSG